MDELLELRGIVEAPPEAVADLLLDVRPGGRSPLATTGPAAPAAGDVFTVTLNGSKLTVAVDRDDLMVTQRGEWWYQGVTRITPDDRGSLVTHQIFNVATGQRWAVRFVARRPLNYAPQEFAHTIAELGRELGCAARVLE